MAVIRAEGLEWKEDGWRDDVRRPRRCVSKQTWPREMVRRGSGSFEDRVVGGLGQLSQHTIGTGLVAFIVMLCTWTFVVHWALVFRALWAANALLATLASGAHQAIHGLLLYSLYRAVTEDPGFVARHASAASLGEPGQAGFCDKCSLRRPDRAHHCRICKRCVRRMDHHCLFVNNCVGAGNYKFFVLLLFYTIVGGFYNGALSYIWARLHQRPADSDVLDFGRGMVLANGCTIAMISLILLPFCSYHLFLAATNTTTLEALKGKTNHYDLGSPLRNMRHVFGSRPSLWLSPFHSDVTDDDPLLAV